MKHQNKLKLPEGTRKNLVAVLRQDDDAMRLLKLQQYTELFINEAVAAFIGIDQRALERLRMNYSQRVTLLEVAGVLDKECCDFLRKINSLRNRVAHELNYRFTGKDRAILGEGFGRVIAKSKGRVDCNRIAAFLTGYLGAGVQLAYDLSRRNTPEMANQAIDATPTAVTARAMARPAPSAGVHHL